ncbi:MarR family winged helix-turn-helix transcriptional regulator [Lentzea sp. HUAS12]|uniref:MarR family winged helix-turn-helix transcriptional regulator n=1 Tax=Lentzea sp. HUAS12 TaxID=2951806 RepID=UPI00209E0102|nr:MarR family winged helix-turn-helix transcriptional regulator [Lentzea sp. HUAS12]USX53472.1 MarR family winged helix-turn-helix transcriptional regulator [Lentzea sp. HUAS12]
MPSPRELSSLSLAQHAVRLQTLLERVVVDVLKEHGLSRGELDVLGALAANGDARPQELSSQLLLTTGGLSNILRRLQTDGHITREANTADARSSIVRLTGQGKAIALETGAAVSEAIARALGTVDESVLASAAEHLHRVLVGLDEDAPVHRGVPW